MLKKGFKQLSFHSSLYDRIPENHLLKIINRNVNFEFINELLQDSYCADFGRPAKEPEMMSRILILQYLYSLSDVRVIEDTDVNLAYKWFIGLNPEDELPHPSLLAKFRTQRLHETNLDDIIKEIVRQCVLAGIITDTSVSIDATHSSANTIKKVPERIMKQLAKGILKTLLDENGSLPDDINGSIPDYKCIADHNEAKDVMKSYLEDLIETVESKDDLSKTPETEQKVEKAKEILASPLFLQQKGIRSLVDEDARVGHKSKTESFFGYKAEFTMLSEQRIITAVTTENGAYVDGTEFDKLYESTKDCGIDIKQFLADKAYFRKPIFNTLKEENVEILIPVSASAYKVNEEMFSYNKDSDQWFCIYGNETFRKKGEKTSKGRDAIAYFFTKDICSRCPHKKDCSVGKTSGKKLVIGTNAAEFYQHSQWAKTDEFKEKYKKRASQEWKNGELKRFHGLNRARGYGLRSYGIQARLTIIAVNLKRIANILSSLSDYIFTKQALFLLKRELYLKLAI